MKLKRSLRRPLNADTLSTMTRQKELTRQAGDFKSAAADPLADYDRMLAAAGKKYGVQDNTVSKKALRRYL